MNNYLKLLSFVRGYKKRFSFAVFFILLSSLLEGIQLSFILPVIDRIFTNKQIVLPNQVPEFFHGIVHWLNTTDSMTLFKLIPITFLTLFLLKQIVLFLSDYLMNDIAQSVMRDVRSKLFERIQTLSLDYFSKKRTGELISRITNDVAAIENAVSYAITDFFRQPFLIIVFIGFSLTVNFKGTMIVFIMFPLIGIPMAIVSKRLRKLARSIQERIADISSHLLETISGVRILKAFSTEKYEIERFRQQNQSFYRVKMKSLVSMMLVSPITEIAGAICGMIILMILGKDVLEGKISFGVFLFFFVSILQVIRPIKKLANVQAIVQQALAANVRIYDVLDTKPSVVEKENAIDVPELKQKVIFDHVSFSYEKDSSMVLTDINLEIKKGDLVAVVGPTGGGKSTLVNLIPRFYDASQGTVTFDGMNVKDVSFKSLRSQIGIVTQEAVLFNDTVKNNIAYGSFDATDEEIKAAAKHAYADHFITKMPNGYDTVVGDRGFRLSGGEKQRLTIARALLKNPPILILDEATSSLDSESEQYVQQALDELMQGRTVVAIAHRLSTIMKANKIVVIEAGKVVGCGPHDDLLFSCPLYRRLYETQFHQSK